LMHLVALAPEPCQRAVEEDTIEQHESLDGARELRRPAQPCVPLTDGLVEGLVVHVIHAPPTMPARLRRCHATAVQELDELVDLLPVRQPRPGAVLPSDEDTGVEHHVHQEAGLALCEPELRDLLDALVEGHRSSSSARSGSNLWPRPVRPPTRAPLTRNIVNPALALPDTCCPR